MSSFTSRSVRWLARLLASKPETVKGLMPGVEVALDGASAAAISEALWCDTACLGASFPASVAARAWEDLGRRVNVFGASASTLGCATAGGALSAAIGVSSAGRRATAFVSGHDLSSLEELLHQASGSRVPLVIHVAARARTGHAVSFGGGHESWHAASDSGWGQLFAINAQEAVDLALVARLAAERSLTPVMLGMDGPETALAVQDVRLPERGLVRGLLRPPTVRIESSTAAQRTLFGDHRRAVPAWFDPDEPASLGTAEPPALAQAGRLGAGDFFAVDVGPSITGAMSRVSAMTGRELTPVLDDKTHDAELVIVAMGAAVETALLAADRLRARTQIRAGVLGIRQTRPWPEDQIIDVLRRATSIVVLERTGTPMAGRGPLTREVLSSLAGLAVTPTVCGAWHGVGGTACRASEIIEACRATFEGRPGPHLLGVGVEPTTHTTPRERVVLDATRRDYPGLLERSHHTSARPELQPDGVESISIFRRPGSADEPAAGLIARVVHAVAGARLRSRPWIDTHRPAEMAIDRLAIGPGAIAPTRDLAHTAVMVSSLVSGHIDPVARIRDGGTLLVPLDASGRPPALISADTLERAAARDITVLGVPVPSAKAYEKPEPAWRRHEAMAGAAARIATPGLVSKKLAVEEARKARLALFDAPDADGVNDRIAAFETGFEGVRTLTATDVAPEPGPAASVRDRRNRAFAGSPVNDPSAHWARTGAGFAMGRVGESTMDPFASTGLTPGRSSVSRAFTSQDDRLVEFVPSECIGAGALWTGCPDGSIVAGAMGIEPILRAGMALASGADALTPLVGKLSTLAHREALAAEHGPGTMRAACEGAYATLIEKMAPDASRREAIDAAFDAAMGAIGALPIARTEALFSERERAKPGSGAFLVIGSDPDHCLHAGAAAGEAVGHGLRLVARTEVTLERARRLWSLFEALPDTPGDVIEFARTHSGLGPLAAAMLARSCATALSGGDDAEAGSGARLALRQTLAVCESEMQPRWQRLVGEIEDLRGGLKVKIRETLSEAVPDEDLDALAEGLGATGGDDVDLSALGQRVGVDRPRVDTAALRVYVELARELEAIAWRLTEGPTGAGRARFGAAIGLGPATMWLGSAPFNPLGAPAMVDASMFTPELARGLFQSQTVESLRVVRAVRLAKAAIENAAGAAKEAGRLAALGWEDLSDDEKCVCAPVLLVGDDESLTRGQLGSLLWLLEAGVPVKAVLLSDASAGVQTGWGVDAFGSYPSGAGADVAMLALLGRKSYVAQVSIASGDHLAEAVVGAIRHDGPALISVHAPSPGRHGFAVERTLAQARLAVESRVWPLWRFDPAGEGVFGTCMSLAGNPAVDADSAGASPLDWAISEARFRGQFRPATTRDTLTVKDPLDRSVWSPSEALRAFAGERTRHWRVLQELAGVVTPFTERVRAEAERAVASEREHEIAALKAEHERALADLRAEFEADAVGRVREGLLALAGYGEGDRNGSSAEQPPSPLRGAASPVGGGGEEEDRRDACPTGEGEAG